jgi:hypothetical protein
MTDFRFCDGSNTNIRIKRKRKGNIVRIYFFVFP